MIDLYTWPTPNGHKVHIMLEETGLAYRVIPVDIGRGDQFDPAFLAISPNNRMPAFVDHDGPDGEAISIFESGAILVYLAGKTGRFMPGDTRGRTLVLQWLMFQMGGIGPMFGQCHHFRNYAPEPIAYAIDRYTNETGRLYGVLDKRLGEADYMAGDYSIADMATYPWTRSIERQGVDPADYPNVVRWQQRLEERPAVVRGCAVLSDRQRSAEMTDEERDILFGSAQYERR
ncbi:MAG: glutathione S-transferase N-terminal domain-containing protein [bacterium]|nr:glutathione S-transferase N-terminal domain-containing protein [bacterium]MDE0418537.1 glutathione S-transferase N-terminal domain-containing protein [bacterium]